MTGWSEVAKLADVPPGSALEVEHEGRTYALFRLDDRVVALAGLCPHQGDHLALGPVADRAVTCPRRGCLRWRFDLETGEASVGEGLRLGRPEVRVEGGSILLARPGP